MHISSISTYNEPRISIFRLKDGTQLYLSLRSYDHESIEVAKSSIEQCVLVIKKWMASNFLKLNDDKTELLVVHPKHIETPSLRSIAVGDEVINSSECARNIGVMLDQNLNMEQQITTICKSAFLHILHNSKSCLSSQFARLIMGTNKRDHIRPVLKKLHWLPIDNRIVFKILLLTFKARAKFAPQYIQDLINDYTPRETCALVQKSAKNS